MLQTVELANYLQALQTTPAVDPSGNPTGETASNYYARAIVNEPTQLRSIWYEIEVSYRLFCSGNDIAPVDEAESAGRAPDHFSRSDSATYVIECKAKDDNTEAESSLANFGFRIADRMLSSYGIERLLGDGSLAIRVSCEQDLAPLVEGDPAKRNDLIDNLSGHAAELITSAQTRRDTELFGFPLSIHIDAHVHNPITVKLTPDQIEHIENHGDPRDFLNLHRLLGLNPDVLNTNGHGVLHCRRTGPTNIEVFASFAFTLDIPWDFPIHEPLARTIKKIPQQLSSFSNIVGFIRVQPGIIRHMLDQTTTDHRGNSISKWKRLAQRIHGQFQNSHNARLSAVVVTTEVTLISKEDEIDQYRLSYPIAIFKNPRTSSPIWLEQLEQSTLKIDYAFSLTANHGLRRQDF